MASYTNYSYFSLNIARNTNYAYVSLLAMPHTGTFQHVTGRQIVAGAPSGSFSLDRNLYAALKVSATAWDTAEALLLKVYDDRWCPVVACYARSVDGWRQV